MTRKGSRQTEQRRLEQALLEGLRSGAPTKMNAKDWRNLRAAVRRHLGGRAKA